MKLSPCIDILIASVRCFWRVQDFSLQNLNSRTNWLISLWILMYHYYDIQRSTFKEQLKGGVHGMQLLIQLKCENCLQTVT